MIKIFDILFSFVLIIFLLIPITVICVIIYFDTKSSPIFFSNRVGINNIIFSMPKLRTMHKNTPQLATHLLTNPSQYISKFGGFLRKYSIDEIPQLFSVLKGDMSLFGPRPALFNQYDLISLREKHDIHCLKPGITGLAQVKLRDNTSIKNKVLIEKIYLKNYSFCFNLKILFETFFVVILKKNISH